VVVVVCNKELATDLLARGVCGVISWSRSSKFMASLPQMVFLQSLK
jgi:hypothetical protein